MIHFLALLAATSPKLDPDVPWNYSGPMSALLADGKTPATSTGGLPFKIVLRDGGKTIEGAAFGLNLPDGAGTIHLKLDGLTFASGTVTGKASISNSSSNAIEGVRFDIDSATDFENAPDGSTKSNPETIRMTSPIHFRRLR